MVLEASANRGVYNMTVGGGEAGRARAFLPGVGWALDP